MKTHKTEQELQRSLLKGGICASLLNIYPDNNEIALKSGALSAASMLFVMVAGLEVVFHNEINYVYF